MLFEVSCPLCCSRPSLGPLDDLSSCSFEGQYAPRSPDTRTNDEKHRQQRAAAGGRTHDNGHNLRDPKRGPVGPSPLKKARHSGESTRNESRSNAESTNLQNSARRERLRRPRSPGLSQNGDDKPKQPGWSPGSVLLRINAMALGRTVRLQDCSGETCSLSENQLLR